MMVPDWAAPDWVAALSSTRVGGVSEGPWGLAGGGAGGLNLGDACGDLPHAVEANRARLRRVLPGEPRWLRQVHGTVVVDIAEVAGAAEVVAAPVADAAVTSLPGVVLAIQTADCLPVLFADARRRVVGAAHAGWRGLCAGVLEASVDALCERGARPDSLCAWLGPAIGPAAFEVGDEVREAFELRDRSAARHFVPGPAAGKWFADLPAIARDRLRACGVDRVVGSDACTYHDPQRFYSYRRDGRTGRMASFIWIRR